MRSTSVRLPHGASQTHTSLTMFRRVQVVRQHCHIAPAGPACLNNNASFRRGRPSSFARSMRASLSAHVVSSEAIRS